jgi:hypothetical protein
MVQCRELMVTVVSNPKSMKRVEENGITTVFTHLIHQISEPSDFSSIDDERSIFQWNAGCPGVHERIGLRESVDRGMGAVHLGCAKRRC